jgi:hypothetical protein
METDNTSLKSTFIDRFSIDKGGNINFDDFWIYIDRDYNLDFYKVNLNKNTIKISEEINKKEDPLQVKVIEKELDEIKSKMNDNEDYEYEEHEVIHLQNYLYNPELKYVKTTYKEKINNNQEDDDEDKDEDSNKNINSEYQSDNDEPCISINGDFNLIQTDFDISNYEVFLLDSNKNLMSYTEINNDDPLYRISIYENNRMDLNIIGTKTIQYEIYNLDNQNINKPFSFKNIGIIYHNLN